MGSQMFDRPSEDPAAGELAVELDDTLDLHTPSPESLEGPFNQAAIELNNATQDTTLDLDVPDDRAYRERQIDIGQNFVPKRGKESDREIDLDRINEELLEVFFEE